MNSYKFKSNITPDETKKDENFQVQDLQTIAKGQKKRLQMKMESKQISLKNGWKEIEKYSDDGAYFTYKKNKFYDHLTL